MISIIIPAYNEENYLEKTLQSIEDQHFMDYEIIVVANGCTDSTIQIAKKHADRIFSINVPNTSLARNIGAQHAKGDILIFLDADTRLASNALEQIQSQFSQHDAAATLHGHPNTPKLRYKLLLELKNLLNATKLHTGSSGVIITHKHIFSKINGFNQSLKIKENSNFIHKAKQLGNYKIIKNTQAITSTRRYERWGLLRTTLFWLIGNFTYKGNYEPVR